MYPCTLVDRFSWIGNSSDPVTGLWKVCLQVDHHDYQIQSVEHIDVIFRAVHLILVYNKGVLPPDLDFSVSLDIFHLYYVNKYSNHHANEMAF